MRTTKKHAETADVTADRVGVVLHDMCQPLTVLRCRLELGLLFGEPEAMREALKDGLAACVRLSRSVERMRSLVDGPDDSNSNAGRV